ncbi:pathogenesis-related homeodomain protein [Coffea eugenioides]|uniref:pathogenesis-related homeodomain protein-like n=1 Tax=Coffea eugenioides TaxID=49369 RepID=UPI000F60D718|nr:pathogenesis-related homeodomain protein-like [Coffea eugenioides]XP_027163157.1 pathogenesis-related homeodomain protein [Coffea eugenioides]
MNMDVVRESSLSESHLSPEQRALELGNGFVSGNRCTESVVQKCEMVKDAHIGPEETGIRKSNANSVEILKTVDGLTNNSDFESFRLHNIQYLPESANAEPLEQKQVVGDDNVDNRLTETEIAAPDLTGLEEYIQISVSPCENVAVVPAFASLGSEPQDASMHVDPQQTESTQKGAVNAGGESVLDKRTPFESRKRKSTSTIPVTARVLRSRSQEKSKESEKKDVVEDAATEAYRRKRRKKKQRRNIPVNEFSRIRAHLRYLLHRIKYEQNLIDAYSGEGWKGQSLEKIKPEKELQRAKSQIFRYKLKIRDLFRQIDLLLAEGKLPETLFDSDGQIDSEDIFCAKCGSKDLTLDNDIILCDGACERGFHQFCLEPPLLKEDIPPDEEGWLCPGCDCKVDCIELLSDFQGSNLSVLDKWEKVFPEEAAAAASGMKMDDYSGLPSDDSDDDDYDPDKPEVDNMVLGEESSSDESDYFSASEEPVSAVKAEQILGLPSDDSEDDDFDPSAADHGELAKQESSSSDFSSDSEDFGAMFHEKELLGEEAGHVSSVSTQSNLAVGSIGQIFKVGRDKRHSLSDELSFLLESNDAPVSGKRHVERLDYKKLHEETYGDTSSDSSDEDYGETVGPRRRKKSTGKAILVPSNEPETIHKGADIKDENCYQKDFEMTPVEKINKKFEIEGSNNMSVDSPRISTEGGSSGKRTGRPYQRLGDGIVQRLLESFRENQYPKHGVKESLAKELGLRIQQVSKWFENARWSCRHSSRMDSKTTGTTSINGTSLPEINEKVPKHGEQSNLESATCDEEGKMALPQTNPCVEGQHIAGTGEGNSAIDFSPDSINGRCTQVDDQKPDQLSSAEETSKQVSNVNASKSQSVRRSGRLQARSGN